MAIPFHDRRDGSINEISDKTLIRHINAQLQLTSNRAGERQQLANPRGQFTHGGIETVANNYAEGRPANYAGHRLGEDYDGQLLPIGPAQRLRSKNK